MAKAITRSVFATRIYRASLAPATFRKLNGDLEATCRATARDDAAGIRWCRDNGYRGYTSYASLDDLPDRDPVIADLVKLLNRHVADFARECAFDLNGRKLKLDNIWVNVMKPGAVHTGHIHPHSVISGTVYIAVPPGSGVLKLEDPRLPMLMAAPTRRPDAAEDLQPFVYAQPSPGTVFLWESWLRHEVMPNRAKGERISVSFNYRL